MLINFLLGPYFHCCQQSNSRLCPQSPVVAVPDPGGSLCYMADKHKAAGKPAVMSLQPLPEQLGKGNSILPRLGAWRVGFIPLPPRQSTKWGSLKSWAMGSKGPSRAGGCWVGLGCMGWGLFLPLYRRGVLAGCDRAGRALRGRHF